MSWGDETSLALGVLRSPPQQAAKREFVADLKVKYADIARLNGVWATSYVSWEELQESRTAPDKVKAREDLVAFYIKLAETYFRSVREAIRSAAPNQLYLGCRFAWVNDYAAKAAGKYCDVVSYNVYRRGIADFQYPGGDKPLLIGEFHFGALDRGPVPHGVWCRRRTRLHGRRRIANTYSARCAIRNLWVRIGFSGRMNPRPAGCMTKRITRLDLSMWRTRLIRKPSLPAVMLACNSTKSAERTNKINDHEHEPH